jgi:4-aminobutyrate aminotransferase-like enzyme
MGLMTGLAMTDARGVPATHQVVSLLPRLLQRGFLFLPEGEHSHVLAWTPPLTITETQLRGSVEAVADELGRLA